jgi:periplasmic protein TonB
VYLRPHRRAFLLALAALCLRRDSGANTDDQTTKDRDNTDDPIFEPGGEVKPPKLIHYVEPEFSPSSSKEAYVEGTVKISTVVGKDGKPTECRIASGLTAEEDRTALEALKQWTFRPGTKADKPVRVRIIVQIDFHLL